MLRHERAQRLDSAALRHGVWIGREHEFRGRQGRALVYVRAEAERLLVVHRLHAVRHRVGDVRDHDELIDLLAQDGQRFL